jgi:pyruvate/2-oxoglutarate dehydrogenase complex dihydrolipoamide dehydrogenase (E3) component
VNLTPRIIFGNWLWPSRRRQFSDFDALNLAAAGVAVEHGRIVLNEFLQSASNPAVYAAGDAAGGHGAAADAGIEP